MKLDGFGNDLYWNKKNTNINQNIYNENHCNSILAIEDNSYSTFSFRDQFTMC